MADVTTTFAAKDESFAQTVDNLQKRLTGLEGDVKGFNERVASMAKGFGDLIGPIAAATAAFLGIKSAVDTFFSAIDKAGALQDLSARTGESVGNLAILQRAFKNAGSSAEAVGPMINRLQKFIVSAGDSTTVQAAAMRQLGLSFTELAAQSPLEQMQTLAGAISSIEDPATRSKMAMDVFGKSGGELMPLLRAMGIELDTARAQLGAYPEALNKAGAAMDAIGDNFTAIKNKGVEFATGLLVNVAPALAEVTGKIAEIDAARLGMILSGHLQSFLQAADGALNFTKNLDAVKVAIQGMADGQISEGLSLMFVTAKIQALALVNEFVKSFTAGLQAIGGFFADMFASNGALVHLMTTVFGMMGDIMKEKLFSSMAAISEQFGPWGKKMAAALTMQAETAANSYKMAMFGIGAQVDLVGEQMTKAGAAMPQAFADNRGKLQPMFDLTDEIAEQDRLQQNIKANLTASGEAAGNLSTQMGGAADKSGRFATDISGAKADVQGAVDLTTGPGGIATATKEAASQTQAASGSMSKAFDSVSKAGPSLEQSIQKAANNFGLLTVAAGREFHQEVTAKIGQLFDGANRFATETTLQKAVASLERLERKLPQPVLV
jgi:hypothetical protein